MKKAKKDQINAFAPIPEVASGPDLEGQKALEEQTKKIAEARRFEEEKEEAKMYMLYFALENGWPDHVIMQILNAIETSKPNK